jgi:para-aminobenzoate synthetase/4-amino-4-deoxychorismate lyase
MNSRPDDRHGIAYPDHAENMVLLETLRFDSENRNSLLFKDPDTILSTYNLDDVSGLLRELERLIKRGWYAAGFLSYEAGYAFDPSLKTLFGNSRPELPLLWFGIYPRPHIWNPILQRPPYAALPAVMPGRQDDLNRNYTLGPVKKHMRYSNYRTKLHRIKDHIRQGNTYQVNLTWNEVFEFHGSAPALFHRLKHVQPVSYAALIDCGVACILSFSPELFFRREGRRIIARPMKGTMARGRDESHDRELRQALTDSEKNRAENLMIVDLLRNDLGKIAEPGSVRVSELFNIEPYPTLFQMTSTVKAVLKEHVTYAEIFESLFPCGSVTGAPKIRSMRIIRELEEENRGVYTGSIGYIAPGGEAVFNVAIRTPVIYNESAVMGVGGGIVWDSDPHDEYRECELKMSFLKQQHNTFQVYESLLWEKGDYFLLDYHMERIAASAAFFGFNFNEHTLHAALEKNMEILRPGNSYKVKIAITEHGEPAVTNEVILPGTENRPLIALCGRAVNSGDVFLYHKTTRRDLYDTMLKTARAQGFWDVLFRNERGEITEGARSNIFIREGNGLLTPAVSCGLLAGTMRRHLLETDKDAREEIITLPRLRAAQEIFMCNSVRKMVKVSLSETIL